MSADAGEVQLDGHVAEEGTQIVDKTEGSGMPSAKEEEEAVKKNMVEFCLESLHLYPRYNNQKYFFQDHERAYFDSADWALGKQGAHPNKPKGPLEALRPKLQPTHQQARSRRSPYASNENEDGNNATTEDTVQSDISDDNGNDNSNDNNQ